MKNRLTITLVITAAFLLGTLCNSRVSASGDKTITAAQLEIITNALNDGESESALAQSATVEAIEAEDLPTAQAAADVAREKIENTHADISRAQATLEELATHVPPY